VVFPRVHGEDLGRAEFHANVAAFTPLCVDENLATRSLFGGSRWHGLGLVLNNRSFRHESPFMNRDGTIFSLIVAENRDAGIDEYLTASCKNK
jgi:hypothetical protein